MKRLKVAAVVGHDNPTLVGCTGQNLRVGVAIQPEVCSCDYVMTCFAKQPSQRPRFDVSSLLIHLDPTGEYASLLFLCFHSNEAQVLLTIADGLQNGFYR